MIAMRRKLLFLATKLLSLVFSCVFLLIFYSAGAQVPKEMVTYKGTVTGPDGSPIAKASVSTKDLRYGTTTDDEGKFVLSASKSPNRILVISYVGFKTVEIRTGNLTEFNVKLVEKGDDLDEVVVVGYGTRKRNEVSGAVTKVNAAMLTKQPITSFEQGLAGMTPGVTLREGTGAPGAAPEIIVRGINGFSGNSPLYVIDDVIFEDANTGSQTNTPFALLNPEDIESVPF
jgi:hypothetical protein